MSSKNVRSKNKTVRSRRKLIVIAAVLILALVLIDLSPIGGNIRFYAKWIECGQKPFMAIGSGFWNQGGMYYTEAPAFQPALRNPQLYCTPIEAERDGYSATEGENDFPNLEAAGEPTRFERQIENLKNR